MLETRILRIVDGGDADAAARRSLGEATDASRRPFMVGRRSPEGEWTWIAPESREARSFLPGPFSLTLLLRGRRAGG